MLATHRYHFAVGLFVSLLPMLSVAAPIDPNALALTWHRSSFSERQAYAARAAIICHSSSCGAIEIRACIDEAFRPPVQKQMKEITIGEAAVTCIKILHAKD